MIISGGLPVVLNDNQKLANVPPEYNLAFFPTTGLKTRSLLTKLPHNSKDTDNAHIYRNNIIKHI